MHSPLSDEIDLVVAGFPVRDDETLLVFHRKLERWLPPGGHIETNETPDQAVKRELREELDIEVELFPYNNLDVTDAVKRNLAQPFHVNVHSVGDHDHCTFFYLCRPTSSEFDPKRDEVEQAGWFSAAELESDRVPDDVEDLGKLAIEQSRSANAPDGVFTR